MENGKRAQLSEEELEGVSGGYSVNINEYTCDNFVCVWCGQKKASPTATEHSCPEQGALPVGNKWVDPVLSNTCYECAYLGSCSRIR